MEISLVIFAISFGMCFAGNYKIVDGTKADDGEWPWQLALFKGSKYQCGASILGPTWGVTAAHCVGGNAKSYSIIAGTNHVKAKCDEGECQKRVLSNATQHPNYLSVELLGLPNDIAYLSWEEPIEESEGKINIKYIQRATTTDQVGKNCFITGWGRIYGGGPVAEYLLEANMNVITRSECVSHWGEKVTDKQVCIYDKSDKTSASCSGDSGGPLVCEVAPGNWELVGTTSWGYSGCNPEYPSVYTRISAYKEWLDSQNHRK